MILSSYGLLNIIMPASMLKTQGPGARTRDGSSISRHKGTRNFGDGSKSADSHLLPFAHFGSAQNVQMALLEPSPKFHNDTDETSPRLLPASSCVLLEDNRY